MAMEYFCCYNDYLTKTRNLSDSELGRLFRALMTYSATGEKTQLNGREGMAFDFISIDIDTAKERYNAKCVKLKSNGEQANATKCHQMPPNAPQEKRKKKEIYLSYLTILKIYPAALKALQHARNALLRSPQNRTSKISRKTKNCVGCCLNGLKTARKNAPRKPRERSAKTWKSCPRWQHKATFHCKTTCGRSSVKVGRRFTLYTMSKRQLRPAAKMGGISIG